MSPADLKALSQDAALAAMTRSGTQDPTPAVEQADVVQALEHYRASTAARQQVA